MVGVSLGGCDNVGGYHTQVTTLVPLAVKLYIAGSGAFVVL